MPSTPSNSLNIHSAGVVSFDGTSTFSAVTVLQTVDGDSGAATGSTVTVTAGTASLNCGSTVSFSGSGSTLTLNVTDGSLNTIIGNIAGTASISGQSNVGIGYAGFARLTSSTHNVSVGNVNFNGLTSGFGQNVGIGHGAFYQLGTGAYNIGVGYEPGGNYTGAESSNILIGHLGVNAESNVLRIGTQGSSDGQQSTCYVAGITGVTVANSAAVLINTSTGQLGTVISSRRYKENIQDMEDASSPILSLRPVTFNFKTDAEKNNQFGLIAEEVSKIMPQLVTYNLEGQPETVHYHDLPVLLLNEVIKLRNELDFLKRVRQ